MNVHIIFYRNVKAVESEENSMNEVGQAKTVAPVHSILRRTLFSYTEIMKELTDVGLYVISDYNRRSEIVDNTILFTFVTYV